MSHLSGSTLPGTRPVAVRPDWVALVPALVTAVVVLCGIDGASYWRDEAATLDATMRPLPALLGMLGNVDAVHGAYYLLVWPLVHTFGGGELTLRVPAALAMAGAAAGVAALGRRLHSPGTGLLAGLLFAVLPQVSRYGQEARSYAFVVACAVLASYLLVRAVDEPGRRWLVGYGCVVAVLGLLNLFGLLLLAAHAIVARPLLRRWLAVVGVALVPVVPVVVLAWRQRAQLNWAGPPAADAANQLAIWLAGSVVSAVLLGVLIGLGLRPGRLARLAVPWLVLPPVILLLAAELRPVYVPRYVAFCLPALALLGAAGLATIARPARIAALLLIAALGMPTQLAIRQPAGHGDDIRDAAQQLGRSAHPGDGVLFHCASCYYPDMPREFEFAYPQDFAGLDDLALANSPTRSNSLRGTDINPAALTDRVWLIDVDGTPPEGLGPLRLRSVFRAGDIRLALYTR